MEPTRRHPEKPGDLVRMDDSPCYPEHYNHAKHGWKYGPKLEQGEDNDGHEIRKDDVGIVISIWDAPLGQACFMSTRWFYVLIPGRGCAWFPLGWLLTADSTSWKQWKEHCDERTHLHRVSYRGFCD